jgi:DNA invertase Pin-like site-specific DNA recombinase
MVSQAHQKVTREHLQRNAYLYVRQSSPRQIRMNQESTKRQYALRQRAVELGWPSERIVTIDGDQGQSGVSAADRKGFQQLVAEVGMGKAGIVLGLEVSRLARNNADWHRLLEISGLARTLILDEDGLYDPCDFNDRLLLGLKGTMSEAEIHILQARLRGGALSKAQRGDLYLPLPIGFVYGKDNSAVFDPDKQVQQSVRLLFQTHRRVGSARGVAVYFKQQGLLFPWRPYGKDNEPLEWRGLYAARVVNLLHNPVYTGAYAYGRSHMTMHADGTLGRTMLPPEQWKVLIKDVHEGYISWEEYERNRTLLLSRARSIGGLDRRHGPPREGCALLQGLVICGVCGRHMSTRYGYRKGDNRVVPKYSCTRAQDKWADGGCQYITGDGIDDAVGKLLMDSVTPLTLEVALNVQKELQQRLQEVDTIRRQQVDRAQYEAILAQRRYMQVDPDNRLVAESLESQWNDKLCALEKAKEEYERLCREDSVAMTEQNQEEIRALATDFPRLWRSPHVAHRDRKRMIRLLIEDVTLVVGEHIAVHVRFKGGATKTLSVPRPKPYTETIRTKLEVVSAIDQLLDHHIDTEVATILNERGFRTGRDGLLFTGHKVSAIQHHYKLRSRYERLRERGLLRASEVAEKLGVCMATVWKWQKEGLLKINEYTTQRYLFEPPANVDYQKGKRFKNRTSVKND